MTAVNAPPDQLAAAAKEIHSRLFGVISYAITVSVPESWTGPDLSDVDVRKVMATLLDSLIAFSLCAGAAPKIVVDAVAMSFRNALEIDGAQEAFAAIMRDAMIAAHAYKRDTPRLEGVNREMEKIIRSNGGD